MDRDRKDRARAEQRHPERGGHRGCSGHRDEAARLPLEQEELHREEHCGERCPEDRGHPGRRACDEQGLALGSGEMKRLGEQGPESTAGHDDRTLGAEGSSGADGYGGGERLEDGNLRLHAAPPNQDGLHRLGNPVPPDPVRPVARHQAHDQPSNHRHQSRPEAQVIRGGGDKR